MSWIEVSAESGSVRLVRATPCPASGRTERDWYCSLSVAEAEGLVEMMVASIATAKEQRNESLKKRRAELSEKKAKLTGELRNIDKELGEEGIA